MTVQDFYDELACTPHPLKDEKDIYPPSETIPNMAMNPAEIVARVVRHLPVPIAHQPVYNLTAAESAEENDAPFDDYITAEDEFDLIDYNREILRKKPKKPKEPEKKPADAPKPSEDTPPSS